MLRVLIVGDLSGYASLAGKIVFEQGARVIQVKNIEEALHILRQGNGADIVFFDITLNLSSFLSHLNSERLVITTIACGVCNDSDEINIAIAKGAKDFLPLPPDPDLIAEFFLSFAKPAYELIYKDEKIKNILDVIKKIAPSSANVLITGESGTGKEVISKTIHKHSKRFSKNFIAINCAAIPENLLESELFGHEKGAFTGAVARRIGKFEEAHGGTLLLDEITEMDLRLQAKLLRTLQEKVIERVGGNTSIPIDIRVIATSNRNIQEAIKEGHFREDLYYRLNVINIYVPPLRERINDIMPLAEFFLKKYTQLNGFCDKKFDEKSIHALMRYSWPGNVRELENRMHRSVLLSTTSTIEVHHIFEESIQMIVENTKLSDIEKNAIFNTLKTCQGNRTHTANILGISIRTLRNKLKEYEENDKNLEEKMTKFQNI